MKKILPHVFCLSSLAFFSACGDETTTNITETTGMTMVEKGAKIPACTDENEGEMVYVADSAAAFFCADEKWQSLKGDKGDAGDDGKQGPKGDDGVGAKGDPGRRSGNGDRGARVNLEACDAAAVKQEVAGSDAGEIDGLGAEVAVQDIDGVLAGGPGLDGLLARSRAADAHVHQRSGPSVGDGYVRVDAHQAAAAGDQFRGGRTRHVACGIQAAIQPARQVHPGTVGGLVQRIHNRGCDLDATDGDAGHLRGR